jgi:hypothetical protein
MILLKEASTISEAGFSGGPVRLGAGVVPGTGDGVATGRCVVDGAVRVVDAFVFVVVVRGRTGLGEAFGVWAMAIADSVKTNKAIKASLFSIMCSSNKLLRVGPQII